MRGKKLILCPKCWKENPSKNIHCFNCGIILQDVLEEKQGKKEVIQRTSKKELTKKKKLVIVLVILGAVIITPLLGLTIYGQISNYYSGEFEIKLKIIIKMTEYYY